MASLALVTVRLIQLVTIKFHAPYREPPERGGHISVGHRTITYGALGAGPFVTGLAARIDHKMPAHCHERK